MASAEERLKILTMIQEGIITPDEGVKLLTMLDAGPKNQPAPAQAGSRAAARFLRVRVTDTNSGRTRVNVRLPVTVIQAGIKMGARFAPEVDGLDKNQLMELINAGTLGQVADIYDDEDGEHVEVFLE
jgi:hypothetical protein